MSTAHPSIDYEAVLADLEDKRTAIENAIAGVRQILGQAGASNLGHVSGSFTVTTEDAIPSDFFFKMSIFKEFNPYLGQHYDSVVKDLGPPTSCFGLSTGDKVCEWDRSCTSYDRGTGGTVTKRYQFVINKDGTVTEWSWRGPISPLGLIWSHEKISSQDKPN